MADERRGKTSNWVLIGWLVIMLHLLAIGATFRTAQQKALRPFESNAVTAVMVAGALGQTSIIMLLPVICLFVAKRQHSNGIIPLACAIVAVWIAYTVIVVYWQVVGPASGN